MTKRKARASARPTPPKPPPRPKKAHSPQIGVRMSEGLILAIDGWARIRGVSRSDATRLLICEALGMSAAQAHGLEVLP